MLSCQEQRMASVLLLYKQVRLAGKTHCMILINDDEIDERKGGLLYDQAETDNSGGWWPAVQQEHYKRHTVPFVMFCNRQCSQQAFVLTSAVHLPYFRMPLSRKKYLCVEKEAQWANEMQPGWYATSLTASLKSLLRHRDHDSLLLMYDVNVSAVRCLSFQPLVCLHYSSSHSVAIFFPPLTS